MINEVHVPIERETDIVRARQIGRELSVEAGFSGTDLTLIATAISEIARNIVVYAGYGDMALRVEQKDGRRGIVVVATDNGPGIPDISRAMQDGFSTGGSLGLGLPGARRLMDELEVTAEVGKGTTVTMAKWTR